MPRPRRFVLPLAALVGLVVMSVAASTAASAAQVVNSTIHVPASVDINPCFKTDLVNLSGDIHVVISTTHDRRGGYHLEQHLNSQLSGQSITTTTKYVSSETKNTSWYVRAPYPAVHTQTYDFLLLSSNGTPNYVLHMKMHVTVTAGGVPTAIVERLWMDCQG